MTCIVALVENGITYFAADSFVGNVPSQFSSHVSQTVRKEHKVWVRNGILFGGNGSTRMLQLLRYQMEIPEYTAGQDKMKYLVSVFIPALQDCFTNNEFHNEKLEGGIILSLEGELFTINDVFGICNTSDAYDAVGKASEVAIGSLHTTEQLKLPPKERLYLALKATERHTCVVCEPFVYITNEMDTAEPLP